MGIRPAILIYHLRRRPEPNQGVGVTTLSRPISSAMQYEWWCTDYATLYRLNQEVYDAGPTHSLVKYDNRNQKEAPRRGV